MPNFGLNYNLVIAGSIVMLLASVVLAAVLFAFLVSSAGLSPGSEAIELNFVDRIYSEIYLFIVGYLLFLGIGLLRNISNNYCSDHALLNVMVFTVNKPVITF